MRIHRRALPLGADPVRRWVWPHRRPRGRSIATPTETSRVTERVKNDRAVSLEENSVSSSRARAASPASRSGLAPALPLEVRTRRPAQTRVGEVDRTGRLPSTPRPGSRVESERAPAPPERRAALQRTLGRFGSGGWDPGSSRSRGLPAGMPAHRCGDERCSSRARCDGAAAPWCSGRARVVRTGSGRRAASTPSPRGSTPRSPRSPRSARRPPRGRSTESTSRAPRPAVARCSDDEMPKSARTGVPKVVMRMLLGLTSRWTRPARCADSSALAMPDTHCEHLIDGDALDAVPLRPATRGSTP